MLDYYSCNTTQVEVKNKISQMILGSIIHRTSGNSGDNPLCVICHHKQIWSDSDNSDADHCCYSVADQNSICQVKLLLPSMYLTIVDSMLTTCWITQPVIYAEILFNYQFV